MNLFANYFLPFAGAVLGIGLPALFLFVTAKAVEEYCESQEHKRRKESRGY